MAVEFDKTKTNKAVNPFVGADKTDWSGSSVSPQLIKQFGIDPSAQPTVLGIPVTVTASSAPVIPPTRPNPFGNMAASAAIGAAGEAVNNTPEFEAPLNPNVRAKAPTSLSGGSGFAMVDGKRINYSDIGTKTDPLHNRGGFVISTGGPTFDDPNVGLAARDAQERQAALDAAGVGVGGNMFSGVSMGRGPGGLVNMLLRSKAAKSAFGQKKFARDTANQEADNRYKEGMLNATQTRLNADLSAQPEEMSIKRGYLDVAKQNASTSDKALSFQERLTLEAAKHPGKDYDSEILKLIIAANAADPQALSSAVTNFQNVRQGKVFVPGKTTGSLWWKNKTKDSWVDPNQIVKTGTDEQGRRVGLTVDGRTVPLK